MVIGADHAALEDGEEVFSGVAVLETAGGDIFLGAVVHDAVAVKLAAHAGINDAFVGHKVRGAVNVGDDQAAQVLGVDIGNVERTDMAVTLDKGDNGLLGSGATGGTVLGLAADIGFIGFHNGVRTAKGAIGFINLHGLADAVAHEPSGFVGDAEHTFDLLRAHALLGRAKQVIAEQPFVKGNLRAFEHGANGDGVLLAAIVALDQARAVLLALKAGCSERTAMGTERTFRPTDRFQMLAGLGFVVKVRGGDVRHALFYAVSWAALSSI